MNIKQAKQEITNTLKAYLTRDEFGNYLIPAVRQRPVLLMGPPGIGKTQIMEQIAAETGVGLVSYTITHHTRQSAMGLPFIEKRIYDGEEYSVTAYTMSEILSSVYNLMNKTGIREGILFLDEINCVSETLAPMMLQFLQCKTFGNQALPEGWLIVAAGNPAEYNRSVREFDVVTLDRVKRINVTEDFEVWKEYAYKKGLHNAVIQYLDIKKDNFYRIEKTADGLQFATARGWEDLSEMIFAYESLGLKVNREVAEQYIQLVSIAKDFANYLDLYYKYQRTYHVEDIISGSWESVNVLELRGAPFDEKISVMGLILSRLADFARDTYRQDRLTDTLYEDITQFRSALQAQGDEAGGEGVCESGNRKSGELADGVRESGSRKSGERGDAAVIMREIADARIAQMRRERDAGKLEKERRRELQLEISKLEEYYSFLLRGHVPGDDHDVSGAGYDVSGSDRSGPGADRPISGADRFAQVSDDRLSAGREFTSEEAFEFVKARFEEEVDTRRMLGIETGKRFDNAFKYLEETFGSGQELVIFVTEVTSDFYTAWFVENFGCDAYFRHNKELLFDDTDRRIRSEILLSKKSEAAERANNAEVKTIVKELLDT